MTRQTPRAATQRWVRRLVEEEKSAALLLLVAGAVALTAATAFGSARTTAALHPNIFGVSVDLPWIAADGLLVLFFVVAGMELRHELTVGSLRTVRDAAAPILGAMFGMLVPAAIYLGLAPAAARDAWGVPMATDLPLALALLAVAGRGLPDGFRAFLLSLAIVDDVLSVVVVALAFGTGVHVGWLLAAALGVAAYARLQRSSTLGALAVACATWLAVVQSGVHPTVLGVALGLATARSTDRWRDALQPWAAIVAVPLFILTALAMPVSAAAVDGDLVTAVVSARIIGKPIGILIGALLAVRLARPRARLQARAYVVAGMVASLGFSVSMLFAELGLHEPLLEHVKIAVLLALPACGAIGFIGLQWLRRSGAAR